MNSSYTASNRRSTKETDISLSISIGGAGGAAINTGIPFFDHMLTSMSFHGNIGLTIEATGDYEVDHHHIVEDVGLVMGNTLSQLQDKIGNVKRFGYAITPMDDALVEVVCDLSKRPYIIYNVDYPQSMAGNFDLSLIREFCYALGHASRSNLHFTSHYGENGHHIAEALFKSLGRALFQALFPSEHSGIPSTKGTL